jgi:hypothetical protein
LLIKAPFRLPAGFLAAFGYPSARRFVALYWEPCGDEASWDDGVSSAVGMSDNWMYLDFIRQAHVRAWIDANGLNLGNSDESAVHWLVADSITGDLYAALRRGAYGVVHEQRLPEGNAE